MFTAILFGLLTFILMLVILGLVSPKTVYVQCVTTLSTSKENAFNKAADFHEFVKWNAWTAKDPNMQQTFSGTPKTIGHAYQWSGNKSVGIGSMEILAIKEDLGIEMALNFGPRGGSKCGFDFEALADNQTKITWWFKSEVGRNPFRRVFGMMMERFITKDFSKGLANLKQQFNA
jgi:hypothetical protein